MDDNIQNIKCVIFRDRSDYSKFNIIKFNSREVAKQYYNVALRKQSFIHADVLDECVKWCKIKNMTYDIIERDEYLHTD